MGSDWHPHQVPARHDGALGGSWMAHDSFHWGRRYARGHHGTQLVLRMGPMRRGLHARPAAAHDRWRSHRLEWCDFDAYHVRRDEPQHHFRTRNLLSW